jgi:hypothetical protein
MTTKNLMGSSVEDFLHFPRFYGLDLIRLLSFYAIAIFHITFIHYYTVDIAIGRETPIFAMMEVYARSLAFSGFTILFLTSMLTAYSGRGLIKRIRLFGFLVFGWAIFSAYMAGSGNFLLTWDVYPLIFFGILIATVVELMSPLASRCLAVLGVILLCIPFGEGFRPLWMGDDVATVLGLGDCKKNAVEWAIFPWMGLVWFGYGVGQTLREKAAQGRLNDLKMGYMEIFAWSIPLIGSIPQWGQFYDIRLGPLFACDAYHQTPLVWWSHLIWVFLAIRLSLEPRIAHWLSGRWIIQKISQMCISRRFWVAYFASYIWAHVVSEIGTATDWEATSWRVDATVIVGVMYFVSLEYVTKFLIFWGNYLINWVTLQLQHPPTGVKLPTVSTEEKIVLGTSGEA